MSETSIKTIVRAAFVLATMGLGAVLIGFLWAWPSWVFQISGSAVIVGYLGGIATWVLNDTRR